MKQRLLMLCADFGIRLWGTKGASVHLRSMARAFAAAGVDVAIAAHGALDPRPAEASLLGARLFALPSGPRPSDPGFSPERMNQALEKRIAEIASEFPFEAIYERASLWSVAGLDRAHSADAAHLAEVNAPLSVESTRWRELPHPRAARAAEERLARESSLLFPVSSPIVNFLVALGADRARIVMLPNAVDEAFLAAGRDRMSGAAPRPAHRPFTIGFVGSLKPWHGLSTLLAAFREVRRRVGNARLLVVGDGPMASVVRNAAASDPAIEPIGAVAHEVVPSLLTTLDVAVAPYDEAGDGYFSPLKVLEYQAAGVPVVASGGKGVEELVKDGDTGLLVPAGDTRALADAILRVKDDPALAARLSARAFVECSGRTWRHNAECVVAAWIERERLAPPRASARPICP